MIINWGERINAASLHLVVSVGVSAMAAIVVFYVWYPAFYREISSGRELFLIVITVDIILGPLITMSVFNRAKPWPVLRRDLAVVGLIQLIALAYGL